MAAPDCNQPVGVVATDNAPAAGLKVIIAGSRSITEYTQVETAMNRPLSPVAEIVSGGAEWREVAAPQPR